MLEKVSYFECLEPDDFTSYFKVKSVDLLEIYFYILHFTLVSQ